MLALVHYIYQPNMGTHACIKRVPIWCENISRNLRQQNQMHAVKLVDVGLHLRIQNAHTHIIQRISCVAETHASLVHMPIWFSGALRNIFISYKPERFCCVLLCLFLPFCFIVFSFSFTRSSKMHTCKSQHKRTALEHDPCTIARRSSVQESHQEGYPCAVNLTITVKKGWSANNLIASERSTHRSPGTTAVHLAWASWRVDRAGGDGPGLPEKD